MALTVVRLASIATITFCMLIISTTAAAYDREDARDYAQQYALNPNPDYIYWSSSDCANFVSQSINHGGVAMNHDAGWYLWWIVGVIHPHWEWGTQWSVAQDCHDYFKNSSRTSAYRTLVGTYDFDPDTSRPRADRICPGDMLRGDMISYDWDLWGGSTWTIDHLAICTGLNSVSTIKSTWQGDLKCQHTTNRYRTAWQCGDIHTEAEMEGYGFAVWRLSTALN